MVEFSDAYVNPGSSRGLVVRKHDLRARSQGSIPREVNGDDRKVSDLTLVLSSNKVFLLGINKIKQIYSKKLCIPTVNFSRKGTRPGRF